MKLKNISFTLGLAGLGLILASPKVQALDFTFSFSNTIRNVNGTVTGTVHGLTNNATSPATKVTINSYPTQLGTPVDGLIATNWNVLINSFTVANGAITTGSFLSYASNSGLCLNSSCFTGNNDNALTFTQNRNTVATNTGFQDVAFTPVTATAVPWEFSPNQGILLGLPLFLGLRVLKNRKYKSKLTTSSLEETGR